MHPGWYFTSWFLTDSPSMFRRNLAKPGFRIDLYSAWENPQTSRPLGNYNSSLFQETLWMAVIWFSAMQRPTFCAFLWKQKIGFIGMWAIFLANSKSKQQPWLFSHFLMFYTNKFVWILKAKPHNDANHWKICIYLVN